MDLATPDKQYEKYSMEQTQKVIDITEILRTFPNEEKPMIVANIGGFSMDKPIPKSETKNIMNSFLKVYLDWILKVLKLFTKRGSFPLAFWWTTLSKYFC